MRTLLPSLAGILVCVVALAPVSAEAHPAARYHTHHAPPPVARVAPAPTVHIVVNPWAAAWRPAPRAGWVWTAGFYDRWGRWHPGHWVPAAARPGAVWVPGHWSGARYVDGYWRPEARSGHLWVQGDYDRDGYWREGYWKERYDAAQAAERREDRYEAAEDRREAAEDRSEHREDRAERAEDRAESAEDRHTQAEGYGDGRSGGGGGESGGGGERGGERGSGGRRSAHHDYE